MQETGPTIYRPYPWVLVRSGARTRDLPHGSPTLYQLCHISIAKYYGMLRNISQFLPVPATLGVPLPALSSPASCPISPGLPPSCPTPYCTTFMIMDLITFTSPLKVGFYQFLFSKLQHTHAKYFDLNCTFFKLFIHQSLNHLLCINLLLIFGCNRWWKQ